MTEEFDDLGMYRRKVEKLKQNLATMALEIGVLKQERAHLYHALRALYVANEGDNIYPHEVEQAKIVLENIRLA